MYGFTGLAFTTPGAVPVENRMPSDAYCSWSGREAPVVAPVGAYQAGGRRRSRKQRGGACGCNMRQTGGAFSYDVADNSLGKMYSGHTAVPCPATPVATQLGGASDHELLGITSDAAGYGLVRPFNSASANFMDYVPYGRSCGMSGGSRKRRNRNRKSRNRNRKNRK